MELEPLKGAYMTTVASRKRKDFVVCRSGDEGKGTHIRIAFRDKRRPWRAIEIDLQRQQTKLSSLATTREAKEWVSFNLGVEEV